MFDAVATLLRKEGRFLYAEASFLVQFKSHGIRKITIMGQDLTELLNQDLDLFFARVNLSNSSIELYTTGPALSRVVFQDERELNIHFTNQKSGAEGGTFSTGLGPPILKWSGFSMTSEFRMKALEILRAWLAYNRENRLNRALRQVTGVQWRTNEIPTFGGTSARSTKGTQEAEAFAKVLPALDWNRFTRVVSPA